MMLSQTAEYALRAAVFLGEQHGCPRTAREIAEAVRVPGGYLSKVLQALGRAGIVHSQRGLGGGFILAKPPESLTVLDIIRVVDPFRRITTCPLELPEHKDRLCPLHRRLDDAMATIESSFGSATLADLLAENEALSNGECGSFCRRAPDCCNGRAEKHASPSAKSSPVRKTTP